VKAATAEHDDAGQHAEDDDDDEELDEGEAALVLAGFGESLTHG
jgi:hypothetical protein